MTAVEELMPYLPTSFLLQGGEAAALARLHAERQRNGLAGMSNGRRDGDRESYQANRSFQFGSDDENEVLFCRQH